MFVFSLIGLLGKTSTALEEGRFNIIRGDISDYLFGIMLISGILLLIVYNPSYCPIRIVNKKEAKISWIIEEIKKAYDQEEKQEKTDELLRLLGLTKQAETLELVKEIRWLYKEYDGGHNLNREEKLDFEKEREVLIEGLIDKEKNN